LPSVKGVGRRGKLDRSDRFSGREAVEREFGMRLHERTIRGENDEDRALAAVRRHADERIGYSR
jgi:hypothetical protein